MNEKTWEHGGPAFPCHLNPAPGRRIDAPEGMKLRDYFAAKALQGILANREYPPAMPIEEAQRIDRQIADLAYALADSMLRARGTS